MQKSYLTDIWMVSKYTSGFRNSHQCSIEKTVLKHFANYSPFKLNTSTSPYSVWMQEKIEKKCGSFCSLWLWQLIAIMKRCSEWCTLQFYCSSLIYVHSKSKVTENIFNLQEWHQNTKTFISYKTFAVGKKKLKPAGNDQI